MPADDQYNSIKENAVAVYKEKGSKFIAIAIPVSTEDEARQHLDEIKKEHHSARHHCYAYRTGYPDNDYRINDDGEPSGTAGRPIYGQILSADLYDVMVVVVRYFGGTKLGVRGLINAYKASAREALKNAEKSKKIICQNLDIYFKYAVMNDVMKIIKEFHLEQISQVFGNDCNIRVSVRKKKLNDVMNRFAKINGVRIEQVNICK